MGLTALMIAVKAGESRVIKILLQEKSINLDIQENVSFVVLTASYNAHASL